MAEPLLEGLRVVDLADEPGQMAARVLADLGAQVVKVEPVGGEPLRAEPPHDRHTGESLRAFAWNLGKTSVTASDDDPRLHELLRAADVVLCSPDGYSDLDPSLAPAAVWVTVSPYGVMGPRARWRGSDLTTLAASGNMFATGDPDRPPVRATEPAGYAHAAAETAVAALTALAAARPQQADVSIQATVESANMAGPTRFPQTGHRGQRNGADIGGTRETWPCKDGWVIFGMRGGPARARNWELLAELLAAEGIDNRAFKGRDWRRFNHATASRAELEELAGPIGEFFERKTMQELYDIATTRHLMVAPVVSPGQVYENPQVHARGFLGPTGPYEQVPQSFLRTRSVDGEVAPVAPQGSAPEPGEGPWPTWAPRTVPYGGRRPRQQAWEGLKLLEFGSGAAGPLITRYFIEHGATVVRIESHQAPDFLRLYAVDPELPRFEASTMFSVLNAGKKSLTLNLKDGRAKELIRRLVHWADGVVENFAPRTMAGWGLSYDDLAADKPDLVMLSSCLWGNVGPHKDYPGFGSQGAALSGYTFLTGWPDRAPVGPAGTITDSLAPRYAAAGLAAALLYRRRTGRGVHLDVSQVEAALFTLSPWLLHHHVNGEVIGRSGNRSSRGAVPHGAFPCRASKLTDDRWVAIAVHTDVDWGRLADVIGVDDPTLDRLDERCRREKEVEELVTWWTRQRDPIEAASQLQEQGLDAYPVNDYGDLHADPQLAARTHFFPLEHPVLGTQVHERSGFRLSATPGDLSTPGPMLGQHTRDILTTTLGLSDQEVARLAADEVLT